MAVKQKNPKNWAVIWTITSKTDKRFNKKIQALNDESAEILTDRFLRTMKGYGIKQPKDLQIVSKDVKLKNPSSSTIARCRKILAQDETETESEREKRIRSIPISYGNPTTKTYRDIVKDLRQYAQNLNKNLSVRLFIEDNTKKIEGIFITYKSKPIVGFDAEQPKELYNTIKKELRLTAKGIGKENPKAKATTKNPHPLSTILRDAKNTLNRYQRQLKALPRNEKAKRENLKTSIAMIKGSIKGYEKAIKNPKAAIQKNPKFIEIEIHQTDASGTLGYQIWYRDGFSNLRSEIVSEDKIDEMLTEAQLKRFYKGDYTFKVPARFLKANPSKVVKSKNFTNADFTKFQRETVKKHANMFLGEHKGTREKLLMSDLAPKNGLTTLGKLALMRVKLRNGKTADIKFGGNATLRMDIRRNLHVAGNDAQIEGVQVKGNGLAEAGKLIRIDYIAAKKHLNNGIKTLWYHKLGEVNKDQPTLFIDKDRFPIIVNGGYDVWDVGIVN